MPENKDVALWVEDHTAYLWRLANRLVRDKTLADELVQETFLAALEARFEGKSSPRTWLASILRNKAMDHFRRMKAAPVSLDDYFPVGEHWSVDTVPHEWPHDTAADSERLHRLLALCLERLPQRLRLLVGLRYEGNKKGGQICKEMQLSTTNYWQLMHRARLQLRACIEHNLQD